MITRRLGGHLSVWCVVLFAITIAFTSGGCVSNEDAELARLLQEIDMMEARHAMGPDASEPSEPPEPPSPPRQAPRPAEAARGGEQVQVGALTIHPDCLLQITVAEDPSLNGSYKVNDIGAVEVGYLGPIILYNATEREAEAKIEEVLKLRDFKHATVKVRILRTAYGRVRIDGSVGKPGFIKVGAGDTISLNNALLRAGGLLSTARDGRVRVYRGALRSAMPLSEMPWEEYPLETADGEMQIPDVLLGNSDVAVVVSGKAPTATGEATGGSCTILVLGEVNRPGLYHFKRSEPCTMLYLMLKMGSLPPWANEEKVRVVRRSEEGYEEEFVVDVDRLMDEGRPEDDFELQSGDRVIVPAKRFSII